MQLLSPAKQGELPSYLEVQDSLEVLSAPRDGVPSLVVPYARVVIVVPLCLTNLLFLEKEEGTGSPGQAREGRKPGETPSWVFYLNLFSPRSPLLNFFSSSDHE